jgi:hypothetical protein
MPLFMDVHTFGPGASLARLVAACEAELTAEGRFGVCHLRFWVSEAAGKVFCLVEADDPDLIPSRHAEAPSLVAREIYPVSEHIRFRSRPDSSNRMTPAQERETK